MAGGRNKGRPHQRTIDKINLIVRNEMANPLMSTQDIAAVVGVGPSRLAIIRTLPLYKQIRNQYMTGIVARLDDQVERNFKLGGETLKFAVPLALQGLVQQALHAKDERVKNKAINDILDRDGTFAKVSRTTLTVEETGKAASDKDNEMAQAMLKALEQKKSNNIPDPTTDTIQ